MKLYPEFEIDAIIKATEVGKTDGLLKTIMDNADVEAVGDTLRIYSDFNVGCDVEWEPGEPQTWDYPGCCPCVWIPAEPDIKGELSKLGEVVSLNIWYGARPDRTFEDEINELFEDELERMA